MSRRRDPEATVFRRPHRHEWIWQPLADDPGFVLRSMFGAKVVYLEGRLVLGFCARDEPWRGILICTDHERHDALRRDFPALAPHPILAKWLYLPESHDDFESIAAALVRLAHRRDLRLGISPRPGRSRRRSVRSQ